MPTTPPPHPPIDRYTVLQLLGKGGMAEVFLVALTMSDGTTARRFALKRALAEPPENQDLDDFLHSFRDEGLLLTKLEHPNIVSVYDLGMHEGRSFLVMEFVNGIDLQNLLRSLRAQGRRLPKEVALFVTLKLCAALHYASSEPFRVIHRDVSPGNVLLGLHGEVKLVDFGIARSHSHEHKTKTGVVKGKIAYMSPEQIDERLGLDHRSDLFALGILLYEMLSGVNPFKGNRRTEPQIIRAIRYDGTFKPLDALVPDLPPQLIELVHRLLAHDKRDRPDSPLTVMRLIEELLHDGSAERVLSEIVQSEQARLPAPSQTGTGSRPSSSLADSQNSEAYVPPADFVAVKAPELLNDDEEDLLDESGELDLDNVSYDQTAASHRPSAAPSPTKSAVPTRPSPSKSSFTGRLILVALVLVAAIALATRSAPLATKPSTPSVQGRAIETTAPPTALTPSVPFLPATSPPDATTPNATVATPSTAPITPGDQSNSARDVSTGLDARAPREAPRSRAKRAAETATLRLIIEPWGNAWLDGEFLGLTDRDFVDLKPGEHKLQIGQDVPGKPIKIQLKPGLNGFEYKLN
jgi:serine/threonine-protein kinase